MAIPASVAHSGWRALRAPSGKAIAPARHNDAGDPIGITDRNLLHFLYAGPPVRPDCQQATIRHGVLNDLSESAVVTKQTGDEDCRRP